MLKPNMDYANSYQHLKLFLELCVLLVQLQHFQMVFAVKEGEIQTPNGALGQI